MMSAGRLSRGRAYALVFGQTATHQRVLGSLACIFMNYFEGKHGHFFLGPLDVLLPRGDEADEQVDTVVQPDGLVVCDPAKVDEKGRCAARRTW